MTADEAQRELERINNEIQKKFVHLGLQSCPRCARNAGWNAEILGVAVATWPIDEGFPIPPPVLPSVVLTCKYCAFMAMHNLKALGIVK